MKTIIFFIRVKFLNNRILYIKKPFDFTKGFFNIVSINPQSEHFITRTSLLVQHSQDVKFDLKNNKHEPKQ